MRKLILFVLSLASLHTFGQVVEADFDGAKWNPPYTLNKPEGWGIERFLIPIDFAPQISYKGVEDIRFAPGWADANSNEYWSYAFLWYLDDRPEINAKVIESNLTAYYNGLVGRNIERREIPNEKLVPIKTAITEVITADGDLKTFAGTIDMLDYMQQKPMVLNCLVHLKVCSGQNKTFVFYQISPKPKTDNIWQNLEQLWVQFDCKNK